MLVFASFSETNARKVVRSTRRNAATNSFSSIVTVLGCARRIENARRIGITAKLAKEVYSPSASSDPTFSSYLPTRIGAVVHCTRTSAATALLTPINRLPRFRACSVNVVKWNASAWRNCRSFSFRTSSSSSIPARTGRANRYLLPVFRTPTMSWVLGMSPLKGAPRKPARVASTRWNSSPKRSLSLS